MEKIEDSVQCSRGSLGGSYEDHENRPRVESMEDGEMPSKDPPHPLRQVVRLGCRGDLPGNTTRETSFVLPNSGRKNLGHTWIPSGYLADVTSPG